MVEVEFTHYADRYNDLSLKNDNSQKDKSKDCWIGNVESTWR